MLSSEKRSLPASTGVWVVNRVLPRTTSPAFSKDSPFSCMSRRMRSKMRKAECPSFM